MRLGISAAFSTRDFFNASCLPPRSRRVSLTFMCYLDSFRPVSGIAPTEPSTVIVT